VWFKRYRSLRGASMTCILPWWRPMTNALIHGNREDPTKIVNICGGCTERSELLIGVTDQGEGFDPSAVPGPTIARNLYEGHDRGVFLMRRSSTSSNSIWAAGR